MCCFYDISYTHFLSEPDSNGVDAPRKSGFQRNRVASETSVCIVWSPCYFLMFLFVIYLHRNILISSFIAWRQTLITSFCVYKQFKGRTRLSHGCNLVIFPCVEINISNPCLDVSCLWLHSYKRTVHETHHITYGVHSAHFLFYLSFLIVKQFNFVWQVKIVVDRVNIVFVFITQQLIYRQFLCDVFYEIRDDVSILIAPNFLFAPVVFESLLHCLHLLHGSIFGILLHASVYGRINLQS